MKEGKVLQTQNNATAGKTVTSHWGSSCSLTIGVVLGLQPGKPLQIIEKRLSFQQLLPPFSPTNILVCPQYFWQVFAGRGVRDFWVQAV